MCRKIVKNPSEWGYLIPLSLSSPIPIIGDLNLAKGILLNSSTSRLQKENTQSVNGTQATGNRLYHSAQSCRKRTTSEAWCS